MSGAPSMWFGWRYVNGRWSRVPGAEGPTLEAAHRALEERLPPRTPCLAAGITSGEAPRWKP